MPVNKMFTLFCTFSYLQTPGFIDGDFFVRAGLPVFRPGYVDKAALVVSDTLVGLVFTV